MTSDKSHFLMKRVISNEDFINIFKTFDFETVKSNKKITYINVPASFDIETSSFYESKNLDSKEKRAIMYEWTFAIYGYVTYGRDWESFINFYYDLADILKTQYDYRLIVYVHNLSFEFQFIRKRLNWCKSFALEERKIVQAVTDEGIEFRCSYKLSGYSLEMLGKQLTKYKVEKMVGDLDYSLIRNSLTPMTEKEMNYCFNDCLVVNSYIQELIERENGIQNIPLTKTGFVRRLCRNACLYDNDDKYNTKFKRYRKLMSSLTLDVETYQQLKRAFAGGFTHTSTFYTFDTVYNVKSYDFTSSYPYVMVSEKFPMSRFEKIDKLDKQSFNNYLKTKCCLFDIEIEDLEPKIDYENYISKSHCYKLQEAEENNGRIVSAKHLIMSITELDYMIIKKFYKWKSHKIYNFRVAEKAYLPSDLIKAILELYKRKTELKDLAGKEVEYLISKENINAVFGMCVTDICRDEIFYENGEWSKNKPDLNEMIMKYNKSIKRFLNYAWGVWITAYARFNLFTGIYQFGEDYIYSDTDSLKVLNYEKHIDYINKYNKLVINKLEQSAKYNGFNIEDTRPRNVKGEIKQLGIWNDEGIYTRFKALGAKRYMVEKDEKIELTVSGLNKKKAMPYLLDKYGDRVFEEFKNDMYIPSTYLKNGNEISATGKQTHTYIDTQTNGVVIDYLGNECEYEELSSIHLEPTDYSLSITDRYVDFALKIKKEYGIC